MTRSKESVALELVGLMRKELVKLKDRLDWLDRGLGYFEIYFQQKEKEEAEKCTSRA